MRQCGDLLSLVFLVSCLLAQTACGSGDPKDAADGPDAARGEALIVSDVSPDRGPLAGGTTITITGENLGLVEGMVVIGGTVATSVTVTDDTTITAVVPAAVRPGPVDVTVFSAEGFGVAGEAFSYNPLPTITEVQPRFGRTGDTLNVTGSGFVDNDAGSANIKIGAGTCSSISITNDTTLTCLVGAPNAPYEPNAVVLANDNGEAAFESFAHKAPGLFIFPTRNAQNRQAVFYIDPLAAAPVFQEVGETDVAVHSVVRTPTGSYFARQMDGARDLIRLDIDTLRTTFAVVLAQDPTDMAFNGAQMIIATRGANSLSTLNPLTGEIVAITNTIGTLNASVHGIASIGANTLIAVRSRNEVVQRVVLAAGAGEAITTAFTDVSPTTENIRDLTNIGGRIFGVRRGGGALLPPPGGGGGSGQQSTLVEIDLNLQSVVDIAPLPPESHSLVEVN